MPREGYDVVALNADGSAGAKIGIVAAGMFCPTVKKYAANAFVEPAFAKVGTKLGIVVHGKAKEGVVVKRAPLHSGLPQVEP